MHKTQVTLTAKHRVFGGFIGALAGWIVTIFAAPCIEPLFGIRIESHLGSCLLIGCFLGGALGGFFPGAGFRVGRFLAHFMTW